MKIPHFRNVTFFLLDGESSKNLTHLHWVIHYFLRRKLVRALITAHAKRTGLKGIALLRAHGKSWAPGYFYIHQGQAKPVQKWIDEHDGEFNVLIVSSCNGQNYSVFSRKSIVIHPNCDLGLQTMMKRLGGYSRVFVPRVGYVEHNRYMLKKLAARFSRLAR